MLPEEADGDLLWLNDELRNGNRPQTAILKDFNARLADRGIGPISKDHSPAIRFARHASGVTTTNGSGCLGPWLRAWDRTGLTR